MLHNILTIYLKEFREVLRDRKTLVFMLVLPTLLVPALIQGMISFTNKQAKKEASKILKYHLDAPVGWERLGVSLSTWEGFEEVSNLEGKSMTEAIDNKDISFAIVVDPNASIDNPGQTPMDFLYRGISFSDQVSKRVEIWSKDFTDKEQIIRMNRLGIDTQDAQKGMISPFPLNKKKTANMREILGENIGGMLPYLFIIFSFLGSLYPAIDLGAGEKERGTLETLLLSPVPRRDLVLGKFLVVFTSGFMAALLSLTSMGVWLSLNGSKVSGVLGEIIASSIGVMDLVLIGVMMVPTAAIFAAMLLSISIFASNFKEAQSYAAPVQFLCILPAVAGMLPGVALDRFLVLCSDNQCGPHD